MLLLTYYKGKILARKELNSFPNSISKQSAYISLHLGDREKKRIVFVLLNFSLYLNTWAKRITVSCILRQVNC